MQRTKSNIKGFTLAEMMLAVGLLVILAAVAFVNIVRLRSSLKQTELDKNAEIIFEAAENQMVSNLAFSPANVEALKTLAGQSVGASDPETVIAYLYKNPKIAESGLDTLIISPVTVSAELYDEGWLIEYNPTSLQVSAVFYYEEGVTKDDFYTNALVGDVEGNLRASRDNRLTHGRSTGKYVGYYSGRTTNIPVIDDHDVRGTVVIENGEELIARIGAVVLAGSHDDSAYLYITVIGEESKAVVCLQREIVYSTDLVNGVFTQELLFDSLLDGKRFKDTWGKSISDIPATGLVYNGAAASAVAGERGLSAGIAFTPGENLTVSVYAVPASDAMVKDASVAYDPDAYLAAFLNADAKSASDNSLFYSRAQESAQVQIACGRHLQNLDKEFSGITGVTVAAQVYDIDFTDSSTVLPYTSGGGRPKSWHEVYGDRTFVPLVNAEIDDYSAENGNGTALKITGLTVSAGESGYRNENTGKGLTVRENIGLFSTFAGSKMERIVLVSPRITGSTDIAAGTGGFAGKCTGALTLTGCGLYMDAAAYNGKYIDDVKALWLTGSGYVGGLIGSSTTTTNITINDSYAATVLYGAEYAGGLVGYAPGNVTISGSYTDCYINGKTLGGLAGKAGEGSTITGSYTAGYVLDGTEDTVPAGFIPDQIKSMTDCYTVFRLNGADAKGKYNEDKWYNTVKGLTDEENTARVYYLSYLPDAFTKEDGRIQPRTLESLKAAGVVGSSGDIEDNTFAGFQSGVFAFIGSNVENTHPYYLTDDVMKQTAVYAYPRLQWEDDGTTRVLDHYGDFYDLAVQYQVNFYYGDDSGVYHVLEEVTEAAPEVHTAPTGSTYVPFREDSDADASQTVYEYEAAHIPQQNERLYGRERRVLTWKVEITGEDESKRTLLYVPDEEDDFNSLTTKYKGLFYDLEQPELKEKWGDNNHDDHIDLTYEDLLTLGKELDLEEDLGGRNPFESVTENLDVYAYFLKSENLQYVRLHYRIFNRDGSIVGDRYVGTARVKATEESGVKVYTVTVYTAQNVGAYQFDGWYEIDETGNYQPLEKSGDELTLTVSAANKGDIYAVYRALVPYTVQVVFVRYDTVNGGANGWGSNIAMPYIYNLTAADDPTVTNVMLPLSGTIPGYSLYNNDVLFYDRDGVYQPSKNTQVEDIRVYGVTTKGIAALDVSQPGTYVVRYKGSENMYYQVNQYLNHTKSDGSYSASEEDVALYTAGGRPVLHSDGIVGTTVITSEYIDGAEVPEGYEFSMPKNSTITYDEKTHPNTAADPHIAEAYYDRQSISLYFDLNGGVYEISSGAVRGYHDADAVVYGSPVEESAGIVDLVGSDVSSPKLERAGYRLTGWKLYDYAAYVANGNAVTSADGTTTLTSCGEVDYDTAGSTAAMPATSAIAVAQWTVSPEKVIVQVYRQNRNDVWWDDDATLADGTANANYQKALDSYTHSYFLTDYGEITTLTEAQEQALYLQTSPAQLKTDVSGYLRSGELYNLINENHFTQVTENLSDAHKGIARLTPYINAAGYLIIPLYYDRDMITISFDYNYSTYTNRWDNRDTSIIGKGDLITITNSGNTHIIEMKGLYEADFKSDSEETAYKWDKNISWSLKYPYSNSGGLGLTFIDRFWERNIPPVNFTPQVSGGTDNKFELYASGLSNGDYSYRFYLESLDGTGTLINGTYYTLDYTSTGRSNSTLNLTNKYSGYEVKGYNHTRIEADGTVSGSNGWTDAVAGGSIDGFPVYRSTGGPGGTTTYYNYANIYNNRTSKNVLFEEINETNLTKSFKYGETIQYSDTSDLPIPPAISCPQGSNYIFDGWFTDAGFASRATDADGKFTDDFKSNGGNIMEDYSRVFFAKWDAPSNLKVNYYLSYPEGGTATTPDKTVDHVVYSESLKDIDLSLPDLTTDAATAGNFWTETPAALPSGTPKLYKDDETGNIYFLYRVPDAGDDATNGTYVNPVSWYRFVGWYRMDDGGEYSAAFSDSERIYDNTDVYAKWKLTQGRVYYQIRSMKEDSDEEAIILPGGYATIDNSDSDAASAVSIYAPLEAQLNARVAELLAENAGLPEDAQHHVSAYNNYYPNQTLIIKTFKEADIGDNNTATVTFFYTQGVTKKYTVNEYYRFRSADNSAEVRDVLASSREYETMSQIETVTPSYRAGFNIDGSSTTVQVTWSYNAATQATEGVANVYYVPDSSAITLQTIAPVNAGEIAQPWVTIDESIPFAEEDYTLTWSDGEGAHTGHVQRRFTIYALNGDVLAQDLIGEGNRDTEGTLAYYLEHTLKTRPGRYRATAELCLAEGGSKVLTWWRSSSTGVNFTIPEGLSDESP